LFFFSFLFFYAADTQACIRKPVFFLPSFFVAHSYPSLLLGGLWTVFLFMGARLRALRMERRRQAMRQRLETRTRTPRITELNSTPLDHYHHHAEEGRARNNNNNENGDHNGSRWQLLGAPMPPIRRHSAAAAFELTEETASL